MEAKSVRSRLGPRMSPSVSPWRSFARCAFMAGPQDIFMSRCTRSEVWAVVLNQ